MNYRHVYHAGNFADVVKHASLCLIVAHLAAKEKPFYLLDSHAGIGRYDLWSDEAQRTGEYRGGIARLLARADLPAELAGYVAIVAGMNGGAKAPGELRWYPGSPRLLRALLRPKDRLVAVELHPADAEALAREFVGDSQVTVRHMDGYQALKAFLPPAERRGLVVVDPPFEAREEFRALNQALQNAHRRWATGIYALWYPIKSRRVVDGFHEDLVRTGIRRILVAELMVHGGNDPERFNGCGLALVNPPWRLDHQLRGLLGYLAPVLAHDGAGRSRVEWLAGE